MNEGPSSAALKRPLMLIMFRLPGLLCASQLQDFHICWVPLSLKSLSQDMVPQLKNPKDANALV